MPADHVIATGDTIRITIPLPAAVPDLAAPIPLVGSSTNVQINNNAACVKGDELPAAIAGLLNYTAPPYVTPGTGSLTIVLGPTNVTIQTANQKPLLIKGAPFEAIFNVATPATMPTPAGPQPDPLLIKPGTAQFITTNLIVKAG